MIKQESESRPERPDAGRDSRGSGCEKGFSHQQEKGFSHQHKPGCEKGFSHERSPRRMPHGAPPQLPDITIERFIDRGGCADVWLARDAAGYVVVKCVRREVDERELAALRLYKQLADDPAVGLMPILHIGRCADIGNLCYTMPPADPLSERTLDPQQYEPATLAAVIERRRGLPLDEALAITRDIAASLGKLHAAGLVHRDVNPRNILRYHGRWRLADTGLLARESELLADGSAGTRAYLPPDGDPSERTADLYALGKTLYAMLNGGIAEFPVPRADHVRDPRNRRAYAQAYRTIARACAVDRTDRYATAEAMLTDLPVMRTDRFISTTAVVKLVAAAAVVLLVLAYAGFKRMERDIVGDTANMNPRAVVAATPAPPELSIKFQPAGGEGFREYAPHTPLRQGDSFFVEASVPHGTDACVVLATYVGRDRSVLHFRPTARDDSGERSVLRFGHGVEADGTLRAFKLPDQSTPLLALLFAGVDGPQAETVVENALNDVGKWPAQRTAEDAVAAVPAPLRIDGSRVSAWPVTDNTRGGPSLTAGEPVRSVPAQTVISALAERFGAVYGVWTHVD